MSEEQAATPVAEAAPEAPTPAPTPTPAAEPAAAEPAAAQAAEPAETLDSLKAQLAASLAKNDALSAALDTTSTQAAAALEAVDALKAESVNARREAKLAAIGLSPEFHALAPMGDPADPAVAAAFEAFRGDPKFARLFTSAARTNSQLDVDHDALDQRLKVGDNPFTSRTKRVEAWRRMKRGEVI